LNSSFLSLEESNVTIDSLEVSDIIMTDEYGVITLLADFFAIDASGGSVSISSSQFTMTQAIQGEDSAISISDSAFTGSQVLEVTNCDLSVENTTFEYVRPIFISTLD